MRGLYYDFEPISADLPVLNLPVPVPAFIMHLLKFCTPPEMSFSGNLFSSDGTSRRRFELRDHPETALRDRRTSPGNLLNTTRLSGVSHSSYSSFYGTHVFERC